MISDEEGAVTAAPEPDFRDGHNESEKDAAHGADNGNGIVGYGNPLHRRARDLRLAAGLIRLHRLDPRELTTAQDSWASVPDLAQGLCLLLIERLAPAPECADLSWFNALDNEVDTRLAVRGRLRGWFPESLIDAASAAAAAVMHGRLRVKGGRHVA